MKRSTYRKISLPTVRLVSGLAWPLVGVIAMGSALAFQDYEKPKARGIGASPDFSKVDFSDIEAEIQVLRPAQDPTQLSALARRNLQYVFFNRLNRTRFLTTPSPPNVAERMLNVLRLNREIGLSIGNSRSLSGSPESRERFAQQREVIKQIEDTTKRLRQQFGEFFLEPRESTFKFVLPRSKDRGGFLQFVYQAERIQVRLTAEMNEYFLAESPGSIHLRDYQKVTITVLTESLMRLCKMSRQGLR